MKRLYLVDQETSESVLLFEQERGLVYYVNQTARCVLPSSTKKLLQHFTSFAQFLDSLNEAIIVHCAPKERQCSNNNNNNSTMEEEPTIKPVRQWYEMLEVVEEEEEEEEPTIENIIEEEDHPVVSLDLSPLCGRAWEWHNDVIQREKEAMTSFYAYSYMLSWASFCRIFYMNILKNPEKYALYCDAILADHPYNQSIQDIVCIIVSEAPVSAYTIQETWVTTTLLHPTMYYRQYSPVMKEYTHIVLFRYATFISQYFTREEDEELFRDSPSFIAYNEGANSDEERDEQSVEEKEEDEDEEELITETFDDYKSMSVPIHSHYSIKSSYLLEGEILFHSQLMRLNLSSKFQNIEQIPLAYNRHAGNYSEILTRCLNAVCAMITEVTTNKILRYETAEGFKTHLSAAHLFHGEKERFTRTWPGSSNEPGDVISRFRPNDNLKISETRRLAVPYICVMYQTEMQEMIMQMKGEREDEEFEPPTPHNLYPFYYIEYEREIVLLSYVCTTEWFNYGALKTVPAMKAAYIIEEMRPLHDIDHILIYHKQRHLRAGGLRMVAVKETFAYPYLVKLMQVYYVIDINTYTIKSYMTHFFAEAFMVWLAISCKYNLIPNALIHKTIAHMVATIQEFLLY